MAAIHRLRVRILMNTPLKAAEVLKRDEVVAGVEALAAREER